MQQGYDEGVTRENLLPVFGSGYGTKHTDLHVSNPAPLEKGENDDRQQRNRGPPESPRARAALEFARDRVGVSDIV